MYTKNRNKHSKLYSYICVYVEVCVVCKIVIIKKQRGVQFDIMEAIKTSTTWRVGGQKEKEDVI